MSSIEELEKRMKMLEEELYETKMIAYSSYESFVSKYCKFGYRKNLCDPKSFNSKLTWLSINYWDKHPARYYINDKYFFKYYMYKMFSNSFWYNNEMAIPLIGVYDKAEDINFEKLPREFVLKRSLGGGASEVMLVDKEEDNLYEVRNKARKWLKANGNAKARIIAEKMLHFDNDDIIDYKALVFNGQVKLWHASKMNKHDMKRYYAFYDLEWKKKSFSATNIDFKKPKLLHDMENIAEDIGKNFPFIRVDFFNCNGKIYIGELTGLPFNCGYNYGKDDFVLGDILQLPTLKEIQENFKQVYDVFPELITNPIYLKGKNPNYKIVQPNSIDNELPLPPDWNIKPVNK